MKRLTATQLAARFNCSARNLSHWVREGLPYLDEPRTGGSKKGPKTWRTFDILEAEEWAVNSGKRVAITDAPAELPKKKDKKPRRTARRKGKPEATAVAALLAADVNRGEGQPLAKRAAAEVLSLYERLQLCERAEWKRYGDAMQEDDTRAASITLRKAWQDSAKLLLDVSEMVPAALKAVGQVVDIADVDASRFRAGEIFQRTLKALPTAIANQARPLLEDQSKAPELARLFETEIDKALTDLSKRLEAETG